MTDTFIETFADNSGDGIREPKGTNALEKYRKLKENADVHAVAHNHESGQIVSTLWRVKNADQSDVDDIKNEHADHAQFNREEAQYRGMEIMSHATPTDAEVDDLATKLQDQLGIDIESSNPPRKPPNGVPPIWAGHFKNERPSIGSGHWLCERPDHDSPERVEVGQECSLGHNEDGEYAQQHTPMFDVTKIE